MRSGSSMGHDTDDRQMSALEIAEIAEIAKVAKVAEIDAMAELAEALAREQFALVYQPIVQLDNAQIVGFEALIRWFHPVRGSIAPSEFIPLAEASGMVVPISDWVIERALTQLVAFDRISHAPMRMFINISAIQLQQPGFVASLGQQILRHGIKAGRVELEITERTVTDCSPATLKILHAVRELGVSVAIDDFGTGYSNLHSLTLLQVDTLKIDMSFTQAVTHSSAAASVSRLIAELGRTLNLAVVVEGIETEGQLNHFRALACPYGQGYLFSKPLAADAACELLRSGKPLFDAAPQGSAPQLLLLDDEESVLVSLRHLFRHDGYRVHATLSPEQAFEILATHPVGVVVSDRRMPRMNGIDFLRQVKGLYPNTVRMVLSAGNDMHAVQDAVNEGAVWKYLSKPWDDEPLREQIRLGFLKHDALREAANTRARLESEVARRGERLAIEVLALESARDTLSMLPIAVLGIDLSHMIVMSNLEADRIFGGGASLMGEFLSSMFPASVEQALDSPAPLDLVLAGQPFRLHARVLGQGSTACGHLLSLVPRITE